MREAPSVINVVSACTLGGRQERLDVLLEQLELCEKALQVLTCSLSGLTNSFLSTCISGLCINKVYVSQHDTPEQCQPRSRMRCGALSDIGDAGRGSMLSICVWCAVCRTTWRQSG